VYAPQPRRVTAPVRWKHTELSHSLNFCYELLGLRAILFPSSGEDMLMSAGEMDSWRILFPAASATSDRDFKQEHLVTYYWKISSICPKLLATSFFGSVCRDILRSPTPAGTNSRGFPSATVFLGWTLRFFVLCSQHLPVSLMPWVINLGTLSTSFSSLSATEYPFTKSYRRRKWWKKTNKKEQNEKLVRPGCWSLTTLPVFLVEWILCLLSLSISVFCQCMMWELADIWQSSLCRMTFWPH